MSINFKPLKDRILVQKIQKPTETDSGIILKSFNQVEKFTFGNIVSVGEEITGVEVSDIIMFNPLSGEPVVLNDEDFILLRYSDIFGIVTSITGSDLTNIEAFNIIHPKDVIVKVTTVKKDVVHSSGIILTSNASVVEHRPTKGEVIRIGTNVDTVKNGDIVEFGTVVGIDLVTKDAAADGIHYVLMEEDRILGKYI